MPDVIKAFSECEDSSAPPRPSAPPMSAGISSTWCARAAIHYGLQLQKKFFGHFLKGEDTGWSKQPKVLLQVRHPGERFVERQVGRLPSAIRLALRMTIGHAALEITKVIRQTYSGYGRRDRSRPRTGERSAPRPREAVAGGHCHCERDCNHAHSDQGRVP
jgi:hypothetical protein